MADSIGVAVVGFGLAGRVFHAPFVDAVPGLDLLGIVERHGDAAARAWPGVRVFRSVQEALDDAAVNLVVVGTPNETHFEIARAALRAGKHVVVDKPFAATGAEARELIDIASEKHLVLAPFHNRRWDGDFLTVRKLLQEKILGRVVTLESHFDRFRPVPRAGTWKEASGSANGMLMDLGPHLVDQGIALFGVPEWIEAEVRRDREGGAIEDAFDITLGYPGLRYLCRATMVAALPGPRFLVHGTSGSYRKWGLDAQEPAIVAGARVPPVGSPEVWLEEPESSWGELVVAPNPERPDDLQRSRLRTEAGDYRLFYSNVRDAIQGTAALAVEPEAAWQVIRLLELARESSAAGRRIPTRGLAVSA